MNKDLSGKLEDEVDNMMLTKEEDDYLISSF
jgi:hypothetical protein